MGISAFNANSVGPDQTPRTAASDLGLHCLSMSLLWNARYKWFNVPLLSLVDPFWRCDCPAGVKGAGCYSLYCVVMKIFSLSLGGIHRLYSVTGTS